MPWREVFSFDQLKAEIDAGRPVMLGLSNHSVVAVGYDAPTKTVYIHDGWDYNTHSMIWGQGYLDMALQDVSIVNIVPPAQPPAAFNKSSPANSLTPAQPLNVSLNWGSTTPLTLFQYCIDTADDNSCTNWIDNGTNTSVIPSNLQYSTTYYWQVRAYNGSTAPTYSNGSATAFWKFRTQDHPQPPAAFNKSSPANSLTPLQPLNVLLNWGSTTPLTLFQYCIDTTADNSCTNWIDNGTNTSVAPPSLQYSTTYYWQVRASNDTAGPTYANGFSTSFWMFRTQDPPPPAPNAFNKSSPANSLTPLQPLTVSLNWGSTTPLTLFQYCIDTTNDNSCTTWTDNGTNTSVVPPNLQPNTTYYWHVRAYNASAGPTYSNGSSTASWSFRTVAAPTQIFADVPSTHPYYQDIEILFANGLTGGCTTSPLKFCPDQTMNRGQAAVFTLRGNYGNTFVPDPATHIFKDDWTKGTWAEPWAEAMRSKGLSADVCLPTEILPLGPDPA